MKKQYALLAVLFAIIIVLTGLSYIKYEHQSKGPSVAQLTSQRDAALSDLKISKQLDTVHAQAATNQIADLKTQNTALTAQVTTVCAQVKTAKLVQPACK